MKDRSTDVPHTSTFADSSSKLQDTDEKERSENNFFIDLDAPAIMGRMSVKEATQSFALLKRISENECSFFLVDQDGYVISNPIGDDDAKVGIQRGIRLWESCPERKRVEVWYRRITDASVSGTKVPEQQLSFETVRASPNRRGMKLIEESASCRISFMSCISEHQGGFIFAFVQTLLHECESNDSGKSMSDSTPEDMYDTPPPPAPLLPPSPNQTDFLGYIMHEVRNPLNAISLGFERLKDLNPSQDSPEFAETLKMISTSLQRARHVLDNTIDLSRLEHGMFHIEMSPMILSVVIETCVQEAKRAAAVNDIQLSYRCTQESAVCAVVNGDAPRLGQVMSNLITNALKFTEVGGRISVSLVELPWNQAIKEFPKQTKGVDPSDDDSCGFTQYLVASIEDTGCGMEEEEVNRLFQPFQQISPSRLQQGKGAGLGLVITKRIVENHGGWVSIYSKPRCGTRISFCMPVVSHVSPEDVSNPVHDSALPLHDSEGPCSIFSAMSCASSLPESGDLSHVHVVLVEDDKTVATLMMHLLKRWKIGSCTHLLDGSEYVDYITKVLASADSKDPHCHFLTLLDDIMPVMTGTDALRDVRGKGYNGPIVMCSGNATMGDLVKFKMSGADEFLAKPVQPARLGELLQVLGHPGFSRVIKPTQL